MFEVRLYKLMINTNIIAKSILKSENEGIVGINIYYCCLEQFSNSVNQE